MIQIGEAAKDLPASFRGDIATVSWLLLIKTRDKAAHQYDQIDWDIVWTTISRDVPKDYAQVLLTQAAKTSARGASENS